MLGRRPGLSTCNRWVQARFSSFASQYHASVKTRPCAIGSPESRDIAYPDEHSGKLLSAFDDSKLCGLLDCINGVGTAVSKTDDLGLGRLGLQQERREIGSVEWMPNLADNSAPVGLDCRCRVAFRGLPKSVIHSYEEPGIAARLHHGFASAMRV